MIKHFLTQWKLGDFLLLLGILGIALLCVFFFLPSHSDTLQCVITQEDTTLAVIPLEEGVSQRITADGLYRNVIEIAEDRVRFAQSSCPHQACKRQGWLSEAGELAVCLPNRVMVRITGADPAQSEVDLIVR